MLNKISLNFCCGQFLDRIPFGDVRRTFSNRTAETVEQKKLENKHTDTFHERAIETNNFQNNNLVSNSLANSYSKKKK